ncbi:hypothetical protein DL96DRAFT_1607501 [Flagelloscypha sp. PMI_526]|nr:hypothetical protein DL96DRAFT_1607501 [Flagelloscypha sp. PMI_526]
MPELDDLAYIFVYQTLHFRPTTKPMPLSIELPPPVNVQDLYESAKHVKMVLGGRFLVVASFKNVWLYSLPHSLSDGSTPRLLAMIVVSDGELHDLECFPVRPTSLLQINVRSKTSCVIYRSDITSTERSPVFLEPVFSFLTPSPFDHNDDFTGIFSWDNQWIVFVLPSHSIIVINTLEKVAYRLAVHPAFELAAYRTAIPESLIMEMADGPAGTHIVNAVVLGFRDRRRAEHTHMAVGLVPLVGPSTPLPTSVQSFQSILDWYSSIPAVSVTSQTLHVLRELGTAIVEQIRLHKTSPCTFIIAWRARHAFRAVHSPQECIFRLDTDEFNPGLLSTIRSFRSAYAPMLGSPHQRLANISWNGDKLFFRLMQSSIDVPPVTQAVCISRHRPHLQTSTMDPFSGRFAWFDRSVNKIVVFELFRRH